MSTHERHLRKNIELLRIQEDIARRERKLLEWELHTIISATINPAWENAEYAIIPPDQNAICVGPAPEVKTSCDPETP